MVGSGQKAGLGRKDMDEVDRLTLDYFEPPEALQPYVSVFYDFRADLPFFSDHERADLAQLRFVLEGGPSIYTFADGHKAEAPLIQIVGPTTGPTHSAAYGPVHVFGCGLMPAGWGALLDHEASALTNRVADATSFFGSQLKGALNTLREASDGMARTRIAAALLQSMLAQGCTEAHAFTSIVDGWLNEEDSPQLVTLIERTGLSRRQVERLCKRYYGSPPKMLARKYRALHAVVALAQSGGDALSQTGFYDQSHMIREIRTFTGVTPKQISESWSEFARLTLQRTRYAHLSPMVTKA